MEQARHRTPLVLLCSGIHKAVRPRALRQAVWLPAAIPTQPGRGPDRQELMTTFVQNCVLVVTSRPRWWCWRAG
jgi:hypothetical protein